MNLNINATITANGQVDILHSYEQALTDISKGALKSEVINSVYRVMNKRFNKMVQADVADSDSLLRHMVEWDTKGVTPIDRLWVTTLIGDQVTFQFRESRKQVPIDPRLDNVVSTDHVFREKARVFEKGTQVTIKPTQMRFLRWYDGEERPYKHGASLVTHTKGKNVFSLESRIDAPGGGKFKNEFSNRFALFWATAGAQTSGELSQILQGSKYFRGDVAGSMHRERTIKDLRKMRGTQRSIFGNGRNSPEVRARAKDMIREINMELRRYGGK